MISYLGSDQRDHLDQHFVSNWPLENVEQRASPQQAIIAVGIGRYNVSILFWEKKNPRKTSKYLNTGI